MLTNLSSKKTLASESTTNTNPALKLHSISKVHTDRYYNAKTGLVHGNVRREFTGRLARSQKLYFALQSPDGSEMPLLTASKQNTHSYAISTLVDGAVVQIGSLARLQSNLSCITYALYSKEGLQIATILYVVPSLAETLRDYPGRRAQVALMTNSALDDNELLASFETACKKSIRGTNRLTNISTQGAFVSASKDPFMKPDGSIGLNFRGRGKEASPKNMQLTTHGENTPFNKVVCQMAKVKDNAYNVDFSAPFTPMTAFAFALAQIDL